MRKQKPLSILAAALGLVLAAPAGAVDGVILIDQNKALAGGVTPGDTAGFPVVLSVPGSYRLSGNLTVPNATSDAIQITGANVTLDLNGFTISGGAVCTATTCTPFDPSGGVGSRGVAIMGVGAAIGNGNINGFSRACVSSVVGGRLDHLNVSGCGNYGVLLFGGGQLMNSSIRGVVAEALRASEAVISNNYIDSSTNPPFSAISVDFSTFTNNVVRGPAFFNLSDGIGFNVFTNNISRAGATQYTPNVCAQGLCP